jgi:hypothetical protein
VEELEKQHENPGKVKDHGIIELGTKGFRHSRPTLRHAQTTSISSYKQNGLGNMYSRRRSSAWERATDERLRATFWVAQDLGAEEIEGKRAPRRYKNADDMLASLEKNTQSSPKAEDYHSSSSTTQSKDTIPISAAMPARKHKKVIRKSEKSMGMGSKVQYSQTAPPPQRPSAPSPPPSNRSIVEPEVPQVSESQPTTRNEGDSEVDELLREWTTLSV